MLTRRRLLIAGGATAVGLAGLGGLLYATQPTGSSQNVSYATASPSPTQTLTSSPTPQIVTATPSPIATSTVKPAKLYTCKDGSVVSYVTDEDIKNSYEMTLPIKMCTPYKIWAAYLDFDKNGERFPMWFLEVPEGAELYAPIDSYDSFAFPNSVNLDDKSGLRVSVRPNSDKGGKIVAENGKAYKRNDVIAIVGSPYAGISERTNPTVSKNVNLIIAVFPQNNIFAYVNAVKDGSKYWVNSLPNYYMK